ncbi:serine hydrolase domain-containing protein [Microlunatus speluncae]|uniref:serine hydrolase domain-containing protein n=1 Tax=Microlunatus speluncae TaxID=2594267 RepID=UPI001C2DB99A|nr:serine hydrolase domain-containing protein [Microlunatus speluncae]
MISGECDPRFAAVRVIFERNFADGLEAGASCCVYAGGRPVVDLWGGHADADRQRDWQQDTLANIASVTKTLAATAVLTLVDRGQLALDEPVARYWPEFAAAGKGEVTLRTLLSHRAGVVSLAHHPITYDDEVAGVPIMDAIAAARPEWLPDTAHGYHGLTIGHALSAIVLRVTGRTVGRWFGDELAGPLGLDCWIGLPDPELARLAEMITPADPESVLLGADVPELRPLYEALNDPSSLTYRAMYASLDFGWESANDPRFVQVEAPSTDGVASAHGLARTYAALIGELDGVRLVRPELLDQVRRPHSTGLDQVLRFRTDFGLGFMLPGGPLFPATAPPGTFGHGGATGSFALADPDRGLTLGYVPNRGSELLEGNDLRINNLVAALYRSVE